jgi:hypothetical protein
MNRNGAPVIPAGALVDTTSRAYDRVTAWADRLDVGYRDSLVEAHQRIRDG